MMGRYNASGEQEIVIPGHPDFIWVRMRGQTSEVVRAFNDKIGFDFGAPIWVTRDALDPRYYRVLGRDTSKYQDPGLTDGGSFTVYPHGHQHSFGDPNSTGNDPVFIFKRQMAQPLLCRPQAVPDMTTYVEADYYFWANQFLHFAGGSSPSLAPYLPSTGMARFVTIYLDASGAVALLPGTPYVIAVAPDDPFAAIPELPPSLGIPLAAAYLISTTTAIKWSNLLDIRIMLFTGWGAVPGPHGLDPDLGSHTGQLQASHVDVADAGGYFTGTTLEAVLAELYSAGIGSLLERVWKGE